MPEIYSATTQGKEAVTTSAETLVQIRGTASSRSNVIAWGVSFDGIDPVAVPVLVQLMRQSTDGTASSATAAKMQEDAPAASCTAFNTFTAEPTSADILEEYLVHPQGGMLIREYPPGREPRIDDATTSRIGIKVTAPANVNASAWMQWEE